MIFFNNYLKKHCLTFPIRQKKKIGSDSTTWTGWTQPHPGFSRAPTRTDWASSPEFLKAMKCFLHFQFWNSPIPSPWAQKSQDEKCQFKMAYSGQGRAMCGSSCTSELVWSWPALKAGMLSLTKSQSPMWLNYQENSQLTSRLWLGRNKQEIISYGAHTASMCWDVI